MQSKKWMANDKPSFFNGIGPNSQPIYKSVDNSYISAVNLKKSAEKVKIMRLSKSAASSHFSAASS